MQGFSRLRFRAYARDLEQAILGLREEMPPRGWPIRPRKPEESIAMNDAAANNYAQQVVGGSAGVGSLPNVTPLPTVELQPAQPQVPVLTEPLKRNVTGASGLGSSVQALIAAIKAEVDGAHADLRAAATEVRTGINTVKSVTTALRGEANDIKSSLGQFSNGGPE